MSKKENTSIDEKGREVVVRNQLETRRKMLEQLVAYRKALGLTQKDLADRMGVSRPNISRFESEDYNPTIDMIVKVADSMGYDVKIEFVERKTVDTK